MSNLTEFLLARIAEDEVAAREAITATGAEWVVHRDGMHSPGYVDIAAKGSGEWVTLDRDGIGSTLAPAAEHTARWDPARALAEVEAKRRLVELHRPEVFEDAPAEAFCTHDQRTSGLWPCPTMRLLALPYADHPGYDPAWEA